MAKLELTYHQAFPEDGDPGWHAGWMLDGRRVHATPMRCNPGELHWAGSVEDLEIRPESRWPGFALRQADVLQSYTA